MTTSSDELIASLVSAAKGIADGKVSRFREHETEASFISMNELSMALSRLADEELRYAIDGAAGARVTKFRPICG